MLGTCRDDDRIVNDLVAHVDRPLLADQSPTPESIAHTLCSTQKTKPTRRRRSLCAITVIRNDAPLIVASFFLPAWHYEGRVSGVPYARPEHECARMISGLTER
jgi:hypothetical protein